MSAIRISRSTLTDGEPGPAFMARHHPGRRYAGRDRKALTAELLCSTAIALTELQAVAPAPAVPPLTDTLERFSSTARPSSRSSSTPQAWPMCSASRSTGRRRPARIDGKCAGGAQRVRWPGEVVDLGTSTNFDVISAGRGIRRRGHRPGLDSRSRRWSAMPASCRGSSCGGLPNAIGANTIHAMQSGTVLGYIGLVSGC